MAALLLIRSDNFLPPLKEHFISHTNLPHDSTRISTTLFSLS